MKKDDCIFYVYVYLDPCKPGTYIYGDYLFNYEPFYIGKGCGNRKDDHIKYGNKENKHFDRRIKKIRRIVGHDPFVMPYKEFLTEQTSFELEMLMISIIGRRDLKRGPLCNLTDGGDGSSGRIISDETREKIRIGNKNRPPVSEETRKRMSISNKGRILSEEHKRKIGESQKGNKNHNFGKKQTKETIEKRSRSLLGNQNSRKYSDEIISKIIEYKKQGKSKKEISKIIGCSRWTIDHWCNQK